MNSPLEVARSYMHRGWMPLPVPYRSKNPGFTNWQNFSIAEAELSRHFYGSQQNIGVLLGKASGDLTDVDLDCAKLSRSHNISCPRPARSSADKQGRTRTGFTSYLYPAKSVSLTL